MPTIRELKKCLDDEQALSKSLADSIKKLEEDKKSLSRELFDAKRRIHLETSENAMLKREIAEWKRMAIRLMSQLMTRNAELSITEEELEILKGNAKLKEA